MNSKNSKTSDPHRLLLNLIERIDSKKDKYIALPNLSIYYIWKKIKNSYKNNKFQNFSSNMTWRIWVTWWIILYIRYYRLFWIHFKKHEEKTVNPLIMIYINKVENRITFKIRTGYYLKLLTPETMQLLGSTNKNGKNIPNLELTEVVLIHVIF